MKDPRNTKLYLGSHIKYLLNGVFIHQSTYIKKVLKHFYMDNAYPLSTLIIVWSFDTNKDLFRPLEKDEEILGLKVPYLSATGALIYLANCSRLDIAFAVNLLARYNFTPTKRHWNGVKHICCYFCGTTKRGYFIVDQIHNWLNMQIHVISLILKQTLVAISSNHSEIIIIHEASQECIKPRSIIHHLKEKYGLSTIEDSHIILFEDNDACLTQLKGGYIKREKIKDISLKFFILMSFNKRGKIDIKQIMLSDNLVDLFTKSLLISTFKKFIHNIKMHHVKDLS